MTLHLSRCTLAIVGFRQVAQLRRAAAMNPVVLGDEELVLTRDGVELFTVRDGRIAAPGVYGDTAPFPK